MTVELPWVVILYSAKKRTKVRTKDLHNVPWRTLHGVWVKFHILVCGYQATTNSLVGMLLSVKYATQFSTSDLIGRQFCGTHNLSSNVSPVNQSSSSVPDMTIVSQVRKTPLFSLGFPWCTGSSGAANISDYSCTITRLG